MALKFCLFVHARLRLLCLVFFFLFSLAADAFNKQRLPISFFRFMYFVLKLDETESLNNRYCTFIDTIITNLLYRVCEMALEVCYEQLFMIHILTNKKASNSLQCRFLPNQIKTFHYATHLNQLKHNIFL